MRKLQIYNMIRDVSIFVTLLTVVESKYIVAIYLQRVVVVINFATNEPHN